MSPTDYPSADRPRPGAAPAETPLREGGPLREGVPRSAASPTTSPRAPRRWIAELRKGDRIRGGVFLVEASNFKQTRNQKYFIQLSLRDRTGTLRAVRWEATEDLYRSFSVDDFVEVDGRVEEFQQQPQLIVDSISAIASSTVDFADFLPVSARDPAEMERELREAIAGVRRPPLRALLQGLLEDPSLREGILRCPAGKVLHHATIGGLLEHICGLIALGKQVASRYPELDEDLLVAAAMLHDLGKVRELEHTRNFSYTDEGQLLGHIAIGLELVRAKAATIDGFPPDLLLELLHIIASHHGVPEHGALKLPMTREAIVFHHLDNIDAKMSMLDALEAESRSLAAGDGATAAGSWSEHGASRAQGAGSRQPEAGRPEDRNDGSHPRGASGLWSDYKPHLGRRIYFPPRDRSLDRPDR